ncbi:glycoside hydrolase family 79 protein [Lentinula aciculospora]|uniref:Glycoside hydrolase family 79 protein n=1 Tax=Lentinula aciculospora TaxID=153920 RepID=A0A9W9DG47_9AGAR|nr:glycoside hydrolase family 79 protein [Lentinula aciculospora]
MLSIFLSCIVSAAIQAHAISVSIPLTTPSNASSVSPSHISFSIEQDRWTDWPGSTVSTKNQFVANALGNLVNLVGEPPRFRIGADSEDRTNYQPGLEFTETVFAPPSAAVPFPEASSVVVGKAFYQAAQNLPPGTHITWGVNFKSLNLTAAFLEAGAIADAFDSFPVSSGITLDAIEIGNEADLYTNNGGRPANFTIAQYVPQWISFASNISTTVPIGANTTTKFWGGAFAGSNHSPTGFSPQGLFNNGILTSVPGMLINTISQHVYSGSGLGCGTISSCIQDLMSKPFIRGNLSQFIPDIAATKAQDLTYGSANVSNSAGAALWALDYAFFASSLGIERLYFHEGVGYKYNFIQPVTLKFSIDDGTPLPEPRLPHVQPAYYGAIVAAEAIGKSGSLSVSELSVNNDNLSGYAFYTSEGQLSKTLFINSEGFFTTSGTNRTSIHLDFSFSGTTGQAPSRMTVKRLEIGHADDTSGLTWGGQTYETPDAKASGTVLVETNPVVDGLDIPATQAVLLTFGP